MEEGKKIFEGKSKKGQSFFIRYPKSDDAGIMLSYINTLSEEQTYVLMQGKKKTIEEEQEFLDKSLKNMRENNGVVLLAFNGDSLIGISSLEMISGAASHVGDVGVSIAKEYRGEGIGKVLMQFVLDEAEKHIKQLRIITLGAFEDNPQAVVMYKKLGFQEYGRLSEGLRRRGKYSNHLLMYKKVK